MTRRVTNGDESDVHSRWRKMLKVFDRPGVASKTKARTNRRERREGYDEIEEQYQDYTDLGFVTGKGCCFCDDPECEDNQEG